VHAMKENREMEAFLHLFLMSALVSVLFALGSLYMWAKNLSTHSVGTCLGPRAGIGCSGKEKNLCPWVRIQPWFCGCLTACRSLFWKSQFSK